MKYRYDNRFEYPLKQAVREYGLMVPDYFWDIPDAILYEIWNGIGGEGDWRNVFIPKRVYFLNIELASLPHDVEFKMGRSMYEYHMANLRFQFNMNRIVDVESYWYMRKLRYLRTAKYYIAVHAHGEKFFWEGKTRPTNRVDNNGFEIITESTSCTASV